jgi:hypothetical protein
MGLIEVKRKLEERKPAGPLLSKKEEGRLFGRLSPRHRQELIQAYSERRLQGSMYKLMNSALRSAGKLYSALPPESQEEADRNFEYLISISMPAGSARRRSFRRWFPYMRRQGGAQKHCGKRLQFLLRSISFRSQCGYIRAERKARAILLESLSPAQRKSYELSDAFFEKSVRSGIHYLFRKGYPLIAFRKQGRKLRPLCTLCMHSRGHYDDTFVGVFPPSDEVCGFLLLLRADECLLWRKADQHDPDDPRSGI